ncbi:MAG: PrsW family intramembrane metalloprotease [Verrucomicrobiaceae bacterium]|nr:PrsW family intramembrane metalloprotease [Verrucomicrobiaceae bacterium]
MSEHSLFHGWRSRVFYITRNRRFLLRTAFGIVALGFITACALVWARRDTPRTPDAVLPAFMLRLQEEYSRLHQAAVPDLRALCKWTTTLMERIRHSSTAEREPERLRHMFATFSTTGRVFDHDVRALIAKHAPGEAGSLFESFIEASLLHDSPEGAINRRLIETRASKDGAPPCANELAASLAMQREDMHAAVSWLMREGMLHADAAQVRESAVGLALDIMDEHSLREMRAVPGWIEACQPVEQHLVGGLLQDIPLQWKSLLMDHLTDIPWLHLAFTLMAGGVWAFILVQHDQKDAWRWFRPVLPVIAGVASIWPTLSILYWQEHVQGLVPEGDDLHKLLFYVIGVGTREEACKLALFALFLPWLLKTRVPGRALLTGSFVGLGFAIEENVQYYQQGGASEVLGRLLTANFLHLCLTGIAGHALYRMFRSGFATAGEFIATFAAVILAHGIYDWLIETDILEISGWLSMVLFFVMAVRFFDLLAHEVDLKRSTFSLRAAFILGCAVIVALVFILAAIQGGTTKEIAEAGASCVSIVPVAILYWRRFENA